MIRDLLTRRDGKVRVFTRIVSGRRERFKLTFIWHLPRWIIYWATIRAASEASAKMSRTPMNEIAVVDVVRLWGEGK